MRKLVKWLGTSMIVSGVVCFPAAIWYPGPWGVISLLLVITGCCVVVVGLRVAALRGAVPEVAEPSDAES